MRRLFLLLLVTLAPVLCRAQLTLPTTAYTRDLLRSPDAATARTKLGAPLSGGVVSGSAQALTNLPPVMPWIWQAQPRPFLFAGATFQRGLGTFSNSIAYINGSYTDAWITNAAYAAITNGMQAAGWNWLALEDIMDWVWTASDSGTAVNTGGNAVITLRHAHDNFPFDLNWRLSGTCGAVAMSDDLLGHLTNGALAIVGTISYGNYYQDTPHTVLTVTGAGAAAYNFHYAHSSSLYIRDNTGALAIRPDLYPHGVADMLAFCHAKGFKVMTYTAPTVNPATTLTGQGNPVTTLATVMRDVQTNMALGFDGINFDSGAAGDLGLEDVRQFSRLTMQAIADFQAQAVDGTMPNRLTSFAVMRGLGAGSTLNTPEPVNFPLEALFESNCGFLPGAYPDYHFFDQLLLEAHRAISYSWAVGPGHFNSILGSWQPSGFDISTNRNIYAVAAMISSPLWTSGAMGEDTAGLPTLGVHVMASFPLLTNTAFISVHQDPLVSPMTVAWSNNLNEVWVKPLLSTNSLTNAVLLVNANSTAQSVTLSNSMLGASSNVLMEVWDVWNNTYLTNFFDHWDAQVSRSNSLFLKVYPSSFSPTTTTSAQCVAFYDFAAPNLPNGTYFSSFPDSTGQNTLYPGCGGVTTRGPHQTNNASIMAGPYVRYEADATVGQQWLVGTPGWKVAQPDHIIFCGTFPENSGSTITEGAGTGRQAVGYISATTAFYFAGGASQIFDYKVAGRPFVTEVYFNGASSYCKTNGVLTASPATSGDNGLGPLSLGCNNGGTQNVQNSMKYLGVWRGTLSPIEADYIFKWMNSRSRVSPRTY